MAGWGEGASTTYYVDSASTAGGTCLTGATSGAERACATVHAAVLLGNAVEPTATSVGAGHIMYVSPGTYTLLNLSHANWSGSTVIGTTTSGSTTQATLAQVRAGTGAILNGDAGGNHTITSDGTSDNVTIKGLRVQSTGAKNPVVLPDGTDGWIFSTVHFNSLAGHTSGLIYFGGCENTYIYKSLLTHNIPDAPDRTILRVTGDTSGGIFDSVFEHLGIPTRNAIWGDGTGTFVIANSVIGGGYHAILRQGTGTFNTSNNILFGASTVGTTYTATRTAGTLDIDTSIIQGTVAKPTYYVSAGVTTDAGTNVLKGANPSVISYGKTGYIVPCVDDSANPDAATSLAYVQALESLLAAKGYHGTWFIEQANWNTANNAALRTLVTNGTMEVASHSYSHSDLAVADGLKIWDLSGNATVDRTAGTITTAGGTVTGFKAKTLAAIKAELEGAPHSLTVTPVAAAYESNAAGAIDASALGEVLKDSGPGTTVLIKVTDETEGLFKAEIVDPKAWLADTIINGAGNVTDPQTGATYVTNSFGHPYNTKGTLDIAAVKAAGYTSGRNYGYQTLGSFNLYTILCIESGSVIGATAADTKKNMYSVLSNAAYYGQVIFILSHKDTEISTTTENGWQAILDAIAEFGSDIQVKSAQEVAAIVRASPWTYAAETGISTRTYTTFGDFRLRANSPAIDAGTNLCATLTTATDYAGKPVCVGGAYVGRLNPEIGAYEFPTVGQSTQKNLNLLWVGR